MPELPEVEVVRAGLARHVVGATIAAVEVFHPRPVRRDPRGPDGFAAALAGRLITGVHRRGKYFWLSLGPVDGEAPTADALLGHLGMSGQMLLQRPGAPDERHLRVRFSLVVEADADPALVPSDRVLEMRFVDQRMFGGLLFSPGGAVLPPEIAHIARDPLDPDFDDEVFVAAVRRRSAGVKRLLLDQSLVSGVGNIYADEALWAARIHGERPGARLTVAQVRSLLAESRQVMSAALGQGGTSFDALYVNVNGESGYFDRSLHAYGREDEPCDRCGTPIRRVAFTNRSSFFCPRCQPAPRRPRA
ncbi:bifunctional DNA-formamidopyrimidine glycosylase/DNA-(apurinic or apyrimidinic site) lyase [Nocardioides coralli]|uniref:bifunctional DNA-formamidopyrimidine glycosylase/DNA-(apurinic or apyrimidinic site) lyase n=1 Tax=Nocardioides coralli TaxID=2872154 RepID=UPI001CA3A82D|nr:bifunctional DNA-formamidopyrimidine glycosylase/DNA-(apurinic or apyrimidinic site) lyase [Nocardioides coralli]QZY28165.1 bifunctional DNA-formamidopyrimidine glycosylase/DNA-(apurinic or apyrimidinic site) lyase [Nocardioides coralli]